MINTILDELKGKILDLKFIERYGSIVVPVSQDVEDEDGRSKRITFPASWDGQGRACYAANDYFELAPNDVYRSVSYWELRGDAVPFVPRRGDRGKWYGFRQSARLVVWLNLQVLGIPETGNKLSDHLSVLAMNALQGAHQVGVDYIDGVRMTVERKVRKSMDIFGPYSYSDRNELLLYPYDFFAIDFQVEWYIKRDCVPGEVPYKALKCAPIEMPGGGAWTPGGGDDCNCRWIDIPDRPHRLSDFENDGDGENPFITAEDIPDLVQSVTGDGVDNTDPVNPVLSFPDADQVDDNGTTNKFVTQAEKDLIGTALQPGDVADAEWGNISGTLSDQTDLKNALDGKFDNPTGTSSDYIQGDGTVAPFPAIPDSLDDLSGDSDDVAQGSTNLYMTTTEKNKLSGIETGADVTDATNVKAAGATMNTDTDVSGNDWVLDEDDMTSDSDTKVPTQQSVKAYVDANAGGSPVNLFTENLTLGASRIHTLLHNRTIEFTDGKLSFTIRGHNTSPYIRMEIDDGIVGFTPTTQINKNYARTIMQRGSPYSVVFAGFEVNINTNTGGDPEPVLRLFTGQPSGLLSTGSARYAKRSPSFPDQVSWEPIQIPEYASDAAADADSTLLSGEPYSITGNRTVYRKP